MGEAKRRNEPPKAAPLYARTVRRVRVRFFECPYGNVTPAVAFEDMLRLRGTSAELPPHRGRTSPLCPAPRI
jgi:hypothetical protein